MSPASKPRRIRIPSLDEDRALTAAAEVDPDSPPLTPGELAQMKPLRGRPLLPERKQLVSVRYSPAVLDYFRATGPGWQSRMDEVLMRYVARRARRPQRPRPD